MASDPKKLLVTIEMSPYFQQICFAAADLLEEIADADQVLVTDGILAAAERLRLTFAEGGE